MNHRVLVGLAALGGVVSCTEAIDVPPEPAAVVSSALEVAAPQVASPRLAAERASVRIIGTGVSVAPAAPALSAPVAGPVATVAPGGQPRLAEVVAAPRDVEFGGIGVVVHATGGRIAVREVMEGFPADRAGIVQGSVVTMVDGMSTDGMSVDQFVGLVRGAAGATVALTIEAGGVSRDVAIARETINVTETRCDRIAQTRRQTEFGGVGFELAGACSGATISEVESGLPADLAGLRVGDSVVAVDGMSVSGSHVLDVVGAVRGPVGSTVSLSVRGADGALRDVELERVSIVLPEPLGCR